MSVVVIILAFIIVLPFAWLLFMHLYGPLLAWRNERQPGVFVFDLIDEREFMAHRSETFIMLDHEMRSLGFDYIGSSVLGNTNTDSFFSLYTKADEALSAMLTTMVSSLGDFSYAEFTRLYSDGSSLEVNNAPISPLFPRSPLRLQLRYPAINSLKKLYDTTRQLLRGLPNNAVPRSLTAGREFREVEELLNQELLRLVDGGYYSREVVNALRPITVKGAVLFSWKSLWPWQNIRQWLDVHHSERLLRGAIIQKGD